LRDGLDGESVDLVYLDPPFNSNATNNVLFKSRSGEANAKGGPPPDLKSIFVAQGFGGYCVLDSPQREVPSPKTQSAAPCWCRRTYLQTF
jgi:hypothetical protein